MEVLAVLLGCTTAGFAIAWIRARRGTAGTIDSPPEDAAAIAGPQIAGDGALLEAAVGLAPVGVLVVVPALYEASGRLVRGMSDEIMYRNRRMREFVVNSGAVMGNQRIGDALFEAGKDALLFPGGAYEANKDLEDRYNIMWKERTGFTRLAARHGVPIVPVGIVGPDEFFGRYMDRGEVADSWLGKALKLFYITQADVAPPTFVISVNSETFITRAYEQYLHNRIRADLGFDEVPVRLVFKARGRSGGKRVRL